MKACKKMCKECPFHQDSLPGWLGPWQTSDFLTMFSEETPFACHTQIQDYVVGFDQVENEEIDVCKGYILSAIKSAKMFGSRFPYGQDLKLIQDNLRGDDELDKTLDIFEFNKRHKL